MSRHGAFAARTESIPTPARLHMPLAWKKWWGGEACQNWLRWEEDCPRLSPFEAVQARLAACTDG